PCHQAEDHQLGERVGGRREERAQTKGERTADQNRFSAEAIGERSTDQRADHNADQAAGNRESKLRSGDLKNGHQGWRNEAHHLRIKAIHEDENSAHDSHKELIAAKRAVINELTDVERSLFHVLNVAAQYLRT